ncbi:MAG: catalase [Cyanobacteria bacterium SZAS-4]|nr:catalase [Cyanobacteria bacterium SZAS-4]
MPKKEVKKQRDDRALQSKDAQLEQYTQDATDEFLTSNQGVRINDNQNSLKAGSRGPSLLEDHFLREKLTHFDHERIPERVVHARGSAAHGTFIANGAASRYCKAAFLRKGVATPVFTRFSTVAGSRGSTDLARDVRGFATKFYTQEGVFDLVGNNMPVFFIQDAIKFPDFVHAVKPEPHNEIPQAQSAHDTFWDFVSINTEATHMVLWLMSDRAIPRSYRMMEGFGVHTFKMIDEDNNVCFVKFHWKPKLGVNSVLWDEALKISGKDPDFHRRDLWDAIESGAFPQYDLGVQVIPESDEFKFDFDLLDPTKLVPEELVPVEIVGTMTLNRNPDNFFAETEQVAFCISHIVPGLDFTNDPLLQGRLFSYLDTQLKRLGGPNFHELPINKSLAPVVNNQRDGHMRQTINRGRTSYEPNRLGGGCPFQAGGDMAGFKTAVEKMQGIKVRDRNLSFVDHFTQARVFYLSQTVTEKTHIVEAFQFELLHCTDNSVKERVISVLQQVDVDLATKVASGLGIATPVQVPSPLNLQIPADAPEGEYQPKSAAGLKVAQSKSLSILENPVPSIETLKVAFLLADGFDEKLVTKAVEQLKADGAVPCIVAPLGGTVAGDKGGSLKVDFALPATGSVLFDALYVGSAGKSVTALTADAKAKLFIAETYKHCKPIAIIDGSQSLLFQSLPGVALDSEGDLSAEGIAVITKAAELKDFEAMLEKKRFHNRTDADKVVV